MFPKIKGLFELALYIVVYHIPLTYCVQRSIFLPFMNFVYSSAQRLQMFSGKTRNVSIQHRCPSLWATITNSAIYRTYHDYHCIHYQNGKGVPFWSSDPYPFPDTIETPSFWWSQLIRTHTNIETCALLGRKKVDGPRCEKTLYSVSDKVRLEPACSVTETS